MTALLHTALFDLGFSRFVVSSSLKIRPLLNSSIVNLSSRIEVCTASKQATSKHEPSLLQSGERDRRKKRATQGKTDRVGRTMLQRASCILTSVSKQGLVLPPGGHQVDHTQLSKDDEGKCGDETQHTTLLCQKLCR